MLFERVKMPTLNQVRTRVDDWLVARWDNVINRQEVYFANHGKYWQGLITHTSIPAHSTASFGDLLPDRLLTTPSDQVETNWLQALTGLNLDITLFPAALVSDAYDGPLGKGFALTVYASHNGTIYSRTQGYGPQASMFTQVWRIFEGNQ